MVGDRIRALREAKNFSQAKLGDLIGVTGVAISGYETGKNNPKPPIINKLAEALGVPVSALIEEERHPGEIHGYVVKGGGDAARHVAFQMPVFLGKFPDFEGLQRIPPSAITS